MMMTTIAAATAVASIITSIKHTLNAVGRAFGGIEFYFVSAKILIPLGIGLIFGKSNTV